MTTSAPPGRPWVVLVGGFLGAGKTTLLLAAARELKHRGMRSAIILNDQGDALVDTEFARLNELPGGEVTGGCFCCKFSELIEVIDRLRAYSPSVILAEPVGSCTDISATVLQPLRDYREMYRIAPLTVLVDPGRAHELLREGADSRLRFLFESQLQEADLICFTKSDISSECPAIAHRSVRQVSAKTGQGIAAWLDEVLSGSLSAGATILDIDYEQYAQAEAALAWLNLQVRIRPKMPVQPAVVLGPLLARIDADLTAGGISIVHLKAIIQAQTGFVKAALCSNGQQPSVEGNLDASPAPVHELLVNLRAVGDADRVREIIERDLKLTGWRLANLEIACFHPAPPKPESRASGDRDKFANEEISQ
ncbi:MAG TPA: GTP-binding protein [Acidobacteriaceae bacterium]|nr:GTP-binding protein [Acidobacteriaceae bacterium]